MSNRLTIISSDKVGKPIDRFPLFEFSLLMTDNKTFGFGFFRNNVRDKADAYDGLLNTLSTICNTEMKLLTQKRKEIGFETIPLSNFKKQFCNAVKNSKFASEITESTKLTVFRFGGRASSGDYRLICWMDAVKGNIFHIIGFDFNYSAYDH